METSRSGPAKNRFVSFTPELMSSVEQKSKRESPGSGAMEVLPAWRDSGLTLSLHWLVWSFFALSFLFQTAAAVVDAVDVVRRRRRRRTIMGDDRATASAYERAAGDGGQRSSPPRDDNTKTAGPSASDSNDAAAFHGSSARWLRFVEYSFSASVMIVAIA